MTETLKGNALLQNGTLSKGTAYTAEERKALGLTGLLPPMPASIGMQEEAMMEVYHTASEEHLPRRAPRGERDALLPHADG